MTRYHTNKNGNTAFTAEEEKAADAADKVISDGIPAFKWSKIREKRNGLLAASDYMGSSDVTMSSAWKTYRAALRDLPASESDPDDITFPDEPS